jgi:hypothetical protein
VAAGSAQQPWVLEVVGTVGSGIVCSARSSTSRAPKLLRTCTTHPLP